MYNLFVHGYLRIEEFWNKTTQGIKFLELQRSINKNLKETDINDIRKFLTGHHGLTKKHVFLKEEKKQKKRKRKKKTKQYLNVKVKIFWISLLSSFQFVFYFYKIHFFIFQVPFVNTIMHYLLLIGDQTDFLKFYKALELMDFKVLGEEPYEYNSHINFGFKNSNPSQLYSVFSGENSKEQFKSNLLPKILKGLIKYHDTK